MENVSRCPRFKMPLSVLASATLLSNSALSDPPERPHCIRFTLREDSGRPQYFMNTVPMSLSEIATRLKQYLATYGQPEGANGVFILMSEGVSAGTLLDFMKDLKADGIQKWKVGWRKIDDNPDLVSECLTVTSSDVHPEIFPKFPSPRNPTATASGTDF